MLDLTNKFGKPICVALYAAGSYLAAKKKPVFLLALMACHLSEYFLVAMKLGKEKDFCPIYTFVNCLCFGFTWWLPIKKGIE